MEKEYEKTTMREMARRIHATTGLLAEALSSKEIRKLIHASYEKVEEVGSRIIEKGVKNGEIHHQIEPKTVIRFYYALERG